MGAALEKAKREKNKKFKKKNLKKKIHITKVRNESRDITTNSTEMKKIVREYYEQLCANRLGNMNDMDKFLETQNLPRLN